jgi:hypothetical protein
MQNKTATTYRGAADSAKDVEICGRLEVVAETSRRPSDRVRLRQLQEAATLRSERARISRFMSMPVAATRCPT